VRFTEGWRGKGKERVVFHNVVTEARRKRQNERGIAALADSNEGRSLVGKT